jgi:GT2 family glycosyltransferase
MIECRIPYSEDGNLGAEYNRIMEDTEADIVMLLDHDVLLLNPHWHHILSYIFAKNPKAGMVTCYTNNIGTKAQLPSNCPPNHDIRQHRAYARAIWEKNKYSTTPIPHASGMLLALRKECWKDVGMFIDGFFKVDIDYSRRVDASKWQMLRANGLYVYHIRERKDKSWIQGQKTSKDFM